MAVTYIVDPVDGSDALAGTSTGTAWRTLNKAKTTVVAGDTVQLRTGNYDESITIARSGTSASPITWMAFPGEIPVWRGTAGTYPLLNISNFSYNIFDGIRFTWFPASPVANKRFAWINVGGASAVGNEFRNCIIYRTGAIADIWAAGWDDWGVYIASARSTRLYRCTIYGMGQGVAPRGNRTSAAGLPVSTGTTDLDTLIEECTIGPCVQSPVVIGTSYSINRRLWIKNCVLEESYQEDGIQWMQDFDVSNQSVDVSNVGTYVSGTVIRNCGENGIDTKGARELVFDGCIIYGVTGSNDGPTAGYNRNSMFTIGRGANTTTRQISLRRSIIYDSPCGYFINGNNTHIHNSTFVGCNRDYSGNPSTVGSSTTVPLFTGLMQQTAVSGIGIKNNIFAGMDDAAAAFRLNVGGDNIDSDWNCFHGSIADWNVTSFTTYTLTNWKTAVAGTGWTGGKEVNSFSAASVAAIAFNNVPTRPTGDHSAYDFGLDAASPCKATGGPLTTTVGSGTNSLTVGVKDAGYFFDGFGIAGVTGDTITLNSQTRIISDVDYGNNILTLTEPVTYTPGQAVYFGASATPDVGSPSFGAVSGPPDPEPPAAGTGAVVVTRVATATATGNQTITFAEALDTAPKALKFIVSSATADNTATANAIMSIGVATVSPAEEFCLVWTGRDAVNPSDSFRRSMDDACVAITLANGAIDGQATLVSASTTNVVINWTDASAAAYLLTVIAYDCAEAYLASFIMPVTLDTSTTISPGFEFDLAFVISHTREIPVNRASARVSYGVLTYNGTTFSQMCYTTHSVDNVSPTQNAAQLNTTYGMTGQLSNVGTFLEGVLFSASGNDILATTKIADQATADVTGVILALRFDSLGVYAGVIDTPTSTGTQSYGGPGFSPSHLEVIGTLTEAVNTAYTDGRAGAWAIGVADTTRSYSVAYADEDAQATSDTQSLVDDILVNMPLDSGAAGIVATLDSYTSSGPVFDFTTVTATAKKWILVALEAPTASATASEESYSQDSGSFTLYIQLSATDEGYEESYGAVSTALTVVDLAGVDECYSEDYGSLTSTAPGLTAIIRPIRSHSESKSLNVAVYEPLIQGEQFLFDISDHLNSYEHETTATGGYWQASIKIVDRQHRLEDWFERGLDRRIVVRNPDGLVVWEGFVNRITLNLGGLTKSTGPLLNIANKVRLVYSYIDTSADAPVLGIRVTTGWSEDTASQARWGIMEKVLSSGGVTPTNAAAIVDDYLRENAKPETDEDHNLGGNQSEPTMDLELLGYVHRFGTYIYNSTTTGVMTLRNKLIDIIGDDPNDLISSDTSHIGTNTLSVPAWDDDDRVAWNVIKEMTAKGDAADNRYLFGVYEGRKVHYSQVEDSIDYYQALSDPAQRIITPTGQVIAPWDVQPGKWLFASDFLIGRVPDATNLREDPRAEFIESVVFRTPWSLTIRGNKVRRLDQKLARLGLAGVGG